jgi:AcrR family transcriptional regulator
MATTISHDRVSVRRRATRDEALDHAQAIVTEQGAGAVTVSEIARRMGMRPPSLYKHFTSLHDIYDALFLRGHERITAYVDGAVADLEPGLERALEQARAIVRWSVDEPGLAALMFWRPVPGFEPRPESFAPARTLVDRCRGDLAAAVRRRELAASGATDDAMRVFTSISAGISSQQMANDPGASYASGEFTSLLDQALDMWVRYHAPAQRKAHR